MCIYMVIYSSVLHQSPNPSLPSPSPFPSPLSSPPLLTGVYSPSPSSSPLPPSPASPSSPLPPFCPFHPYSFSCSLLSLLFLSSLFGTRHSLPSPVSTRHFSCYFYLLFSHFFYPFWWSWDCLLLIFFLEFCFWFCFCFCF